MSPKSGADRTELQLHISIHIVCQYMTVVIFFRSSLYVRFFVNFTEIFYAPYTYMNIYRIPKMYLPAINHCHPQKHPTSESCYQVTWKFVSAKGGVWGH